MLSHDATFPEAKTNSGESTSAEEEQKGAPAAAPEGEESGDAGEKSAENAPEDGEKGEAGEAAEGEKSEKSGGADEQGKKKKKKDAAKKTEWVAKSRHECLTWQDFLIKMLEITCRNNRSVILTRVVSPHTD